MKHFKFKLLILPSIVALSTIAPCITSCGNTGTNTTIKVIGASVDSSKTHIEVDRESTIYLIPNKDSKITGIKSITVGSTVLVRTDYRFEYEQTNGLAYKLTIFAKLMTSLDISIEVHTTDIEIANVSYSGNTQTTTAALKPLSLEVVAKYKDVEGTTPLAVGEYKVFDDTDKDITSDISSEVGYAMDEEKIYNFTIKSVIDPTKSKTLSVDIKDPYVQTCEGISYPEGSGKDRECLVKLKDEAKSITGKISVNKFFIVDGKEKSVTGIYDNGFADSKAKSIEFISDCSITHIQAGVFANCSYLQKINIPANVKTIDADTFKDTTSLFNVYIDSQTIVDLDNDDSKLFANATTIFVKNTLTQPSGKYIDQNFTKSTVGDQYTQWIKK